MPQGQTCGTCGKSGHNTVSCPQRKANNAMASRAASTATTLADTGVPGASWVAGKAAGKVADYAQRTDGQKHYAKYGKK